MWSYVYSRVLLFALVLSKVTVNTESLPLGEIQNEVPMSLWSQHIYSH